MSPKVLSRKCNIGAGQQILISVSVNVFGSKNFPESVRINDIYAENQIVFIIGFLLSYQRSVQPVVLKN